MTIKIDGTNGIQFYATNATWATIGPFMYCHWGTVNNGAQTNINRQFNASAVSRISTGRYTINFADSTANPWALGNFCGARRVATQTGSIHGYNYDYGTTYITVEYRAGGGNLVDPGFGWIWVTGSGEEFNSNSNVVITGDRIDKNDPNGYNGRTQHRAADFAINGDGYNTGDSWATYGTAGGYYTSFLKTGTGRYVHTLFKSQFTQGVQSNSAIDGLIGRPIAIATTKRPSGTGVGFAYPDGSETYGNYQIAWRSCNASGTLIDQTIYVAVF